MKLVTLAVGTLSCEVGGFGKLNLEKFNDLFLGNVAEDLLTFFWGGISLQNVPCKNIQRTLEVQKL